MYQVNTLTWKSYLNQRDMRLLNVLRFLLAEIMFNTSLSSPAKIDEEGIDICVTSRVVICEKGLRELIWLPMSPKLIYLFRNTSWKNSRVKNAWAGVVEGWVTYREVIRDSVWVRPKHGKRSGGDCRVSKQWFRAFGKLTDRPSDGMGPTGRESGRGWPISRGRVGALQVVSELVSHLSSDLRGVLRPVGGATRTLRSLRGGEL